LVGISNSPTTSQTDIIHRYCIVPARMTDEFTDGYLRLVFQSFTDNYTDGFYSSVCHTITDGLKSVGIFQAGNFFSRRVMFVCKTFANVFFVFPTDIATKSGITDEKKVDGRIPLGRMSVNILPTKP